MLFGRDNLCTKAMHKIGVLAPGETPEDFFLTETIECLQTIVAELPLTHELQWGLSSSESEIVLTKQFETMPDPTITLPATFYAVKTAKVKVESLSSDDYSTVLSTTETPIELCSHKEYFEKDLSEDEEDYADVPTHLYIQSTDSANTLHLYPPMTTVQEDQKVSLKLTFQKILPTIATGGAYSTTLLEVPDSLTNYIVNRLAWEICPNWGVPLSERNELLLRWKQVAEQPNKVKAAPNRGGGTKMRFA